MSSQNITWSKSYKEFTGRNIGLLTEQQQESLRTAKICLFGMGGVGSPAFEVMVRTGVGNFAIVDKDKFDASNMNRQIYAFHDTFDKAKVDVATEYAKKINPEINIDAYYEVTENNISNILANADVVVLAIDELRPCLIISRQAKQMGIPLVEGWALPFGNVRVFTSDTPGLEDTYGLPTKGKEISEFSDEELKKLNTELLFGLGASVEGIADFYSEDAINKIAAGHITSFAPMAWLTSVLLANEALKLLMKIGTIAKGPEFTMYDPYMHRIPKSL